MAFLCHTHSRDSFGWRDDFEARVDLGVAALANRAADALIFDEGVFGLSSAYAGEVTAMVAITMAEVMQRRKNVEGLVRSVFIPGSIPRRVPIYRAEKASVFGDCRPHSAGSRVQ